MKRVSIIFLFILVVISNHNVIFASYNNQSIEEELNLEVEYIFKERTKIWNQFLRGEYFSIDELEGELRLIEANPLLKSDIEMFRQMQLNPTSYEDIGNVSVENIQIIKNASQKITLEAIIVWEIKGYEYDYVEEIKYRVEVKKEKNKWLLSKYEIVK